MIKTRLKQLITMILVITILCMNMSTVSAASLNNIGNGTIGFDNGTASSPLEMKFGAAFEKDCYVNFTFYKTNGETTDYDFYSFSNISRVANYSIAQNASKYKDYFSIMSSIAELSNISDLNNITISESDSSININITIPYTYNSEIYSPNSYVSDSTGKEYFKAKLTYNDGRAVWDYKVTVKVEQLLYDLGLFDLDNMYDINTNSIVTESSQYEINNFNITHDGTTPSDENLVPSEYSGSYYYDSNSLFNGSFKYSSDNLYFSYKKDYSDNKIYDGQVLLKYNTSDNTSDRKFKLYFDTDKLYDLTDKVFENKYSENDFLKTGDILDKNTIYGLYNFKYDYTYTDCHWDDNGNFVKTETKNANDELIEYTDGRSSYAKKIIFDDGRKIYLGETSCTTGSYIFDSDKKYLITKIVYGGGDNFDSDLGDYGDYVDLEIYLRDISEPPCSHESTSTTQDNEIPTKCTVDGSYDEVVTCNDCQAEISRTNKKIDKLGHDWSGTWQTVDTPTQELFNNAANSSELDFSSLGSHDTVEKLECKRDSDLCTSPKAYKIKVTTHQHTNDSGNRENKVPADCTHDGSYDWVVRCTSCNDVISSEHRTINKLGHTWGTDDWTVVNNPTQTLFDSADNSSSLNFNDLDSNDTVFKHECSRAQDAYQIKVATHQHTSGDGVRENEIPATCTQDGSYDWVVKCAVCNDIVSTESRTLTKTNHTYGAWQNIPTTTDINTLIAGAENKNIISNSWVADNYHRLQIQYCTNTWNCVRGSSTKAYRLRVLKFEFKYDDDNDNDGKPDVTIDVIEEPKEDGEQERKIDEIDTIVTEKPIVNPVDPEVDDPYVPYIVTPEDNRYDYDYEDERDYRIPTATISVSTNYWKTFLNTIAFDLFFKDTQTGSITYEFKNPSQWDEVNKTSYIVTKQGVTYSNSEIKDVDTWTDGTSFTLTKEDVQKYVAYAKIKLAGGYEFYISSNGMVMDSVAPTIQCQTEDDVIIFSEEKITITDNAKLDKVYIDGTEVSITLSNDGKSTEITVANDGNNHTIKAIDAAGNEVEKVIKFGTSDFEATVEGKILDISGNPVVGATVELHSSPRTATTDANGKFKFNNVEVDRHTLTATVNNVEIYNMTLALTPTYVESKVNNIVGSFKVNSEFEYNDESLKVKVNANECTNHTHGRVEVENEISPTCTLKGSYDSVDYCPNCGSEYERKSVFTNELGHIWRGIDWIQVNDEDITDDLFDKAENTVDKSTLDDAHKLFKRLCNRASDAYELKIEYVNNEHTHTPSDASKENEVSPTCTAKGGYDLVVRCKDCNVIISLEHKDIDALGHTWGTEDWELVTNITEELINNSENKVEYSDNYQVYQHYCTRAHDAYELKLVEKDTTKTEDTEVKDDNTNSETIDNTTEDDNNEGDDTEEEDDTDTDEEDDKDDTTVKIDDVDIPKTGDYNISLIILLMLFSSMIFIRAYKSK